MSLLQEMQKYGLADCEFNRMLLNPVSTSDAHAMAQALADNRAFNQDLIRSTLEIQITQADALLHTAALNARDNDGRSAWHDINAARSVLNQILGGL